MDERRAPGRLAVIGGPMFAGKTTELLRRVDRARIAGQDVVVVAHVLDTRHGAGTVTAHTGTQVPSHTVDHATQIPRLVGRDTFMVAVDEAQFFGPELVDVAQALADDGLHVVVAGLTVTFDSRPFAPLPALMALAEDVTRLTAVCARCGRDAAYHARRADDGAGDALASTASHVGGAEAYEARCRRHRSA